MAKIECRELGGANEDWQESGTMVFAVNKDEIGFTIECTFAEYDISMSYEEAADLMQLLHDTMKRSVERG